MKKFCTPAFSHELHQPAALPDGSRSINFHISVSSESLLVCDRFHHLGPKFDGEGPDGATTGEIVEICGETNQGQEEPEAPPPGGPTWMEYMMILKQDTANSLGSHRWWLSRCLQGRRSSVGPKTNEEQTRSRAPQNILANQRVCVCSGVCVRE